MIFADLPAGARIFLDANPLVYHFAPDPAFGPSCSQLLARIANNEISALTSTHVLSEAAHHLMTLEAAGQFVVIAWTVRPILRWLVARWPAPAAVRDAPRERVRRPGGLTMPAENLDLLHRGKRIVDLDVKTNPQQLLDLVAEADVLLDCFRPGTCERLGIGPEDCAAVNPRLIYARITGWGQDGPLATTAGHDINYLSQTGVLSDTLRKAIKAGRRRT